MQTATYIEQSLQLAREQMERGYYLIPAHMHQAIRDYVLHGYRPGSFLTALLSNNFMEAAGRADEDNARSLTGWATFFYNYIPTGCYRSPEAVAAWIADGGLTGRLSKAEAA